jgi:3-oxoacyl-[acyl-carrier-protein] synthase-1
MVTGVGLTSAATCAAIRCRINRFVETRFIDLAGEWIIGSPAELDRPWQGLSKLVRLAASAVGECVNSIEGVPVEDVPLLLCLAERERPGRLDGRLIEAVSRELRVRFHPRSAELSGGRVAGAEALVLARQIMDAEGLPLCLVAGVDSFLSAPTLRAYEEKFRLLTADNSDGFIPGEAGAALLLGREGVTRGHELVILGVGFGREQATVDSEEPLRADGLTQAIKTACADSGQTLDETDYRITDLNGEQYGFKEAALAFSRIVRKLKPTYEVWHPADCIGEVGAAIVPCVLGVALAACHKGYAPGKGVLCHFGNDDGARAAMILNYHGPEV